MQLYLEGKKKTRAIMLLFCILGIIMLVNFASRKDYADLDRNFSSIYQDRLMPAGYLFKISDHLYQKKMIQQSDEVSPESTQAQTKEHNEAISVLIKDYEATYLTAAEKTLWQNFKQALVHYNQAEQSYLTLPASQAVTELVLQNSFDQTIGTLNRLNDLQASEGKVLQRQSKAILGGYLMQSYLEAGLLFVLCFLLFLLLGISQNTQLFKQRHLLN